MLLARKDDKKKSSGLGPRSAWRRQDLCLFVYFLFYLVKLQFWKHISNAQEKNLTCRLSVAKLFT